jgi:hypothetical protein
MESQNGGVKWQLAGSECGGTLPHGGEGEWWRETKLWPLTPFIGARERESMEAGPCVGVSEPTGSRCSGNPERGTGPCWWLTWRVGRLKLTRTTVQSDRAQFTKSTVFLLFKLAQLCKLPNQPFLRSKFLQTFHECRITHYEQLSFCKQVQIQNVFRIKNLGRKLLLNLGWIYWRFKHDWKNLINFVKFSFALTFQNMNLEWYSCMQKFAIHIQAPFDLVWK